jgi:hypothetical protein
LRITKTALAVQTSRGPSTTDEIQRDLNKHT